MLTPYRFSLVALCTGIALTITACGGVNQDASSRPELMALGGKGDVPDWIKPQPTMLGCPELPWPGPLPLLPMYEASASFAGPLSSISGQFAGYDSAHLYPFWAEAGRKSTFDFSASYQSGFGAAIAVFSINGDRVAYQRNDSQDSASVELAVDQDGFYLIAVYSASWSANGSYTLGVNCSSAGQFCGGFGGLPCPAGQKCLLEGDFPDAGGKCVPNDYCEQVSDCQALPIPMVCSGAYMCINNTCQLQCFGPDPLPEPEPCFVGGCSGQLCSPVEGLVSTCEWRPEYACVQYSECGHFGPNGECGWKPTTAYVNCMPGFGNP